MKLHFLRLLSQLFTLVSLDRNVVKTEQRFEESGNTRQLLGMEVNEITPGESTVHSWRREAAARGPPTLMDR